MRATASLLGCPNRHVGREPMPSGAVAGGASARPTARLNGAVLDAEKSRVRPQPARAARSLLAAVLVAALWLGTTPAAASDLEATRRRAQTVAERVSTLERRLASLRARRAALSERVVAVTQRIAALEAEMGATRRALVAARARYVSRAVEAYKAGATGRLALVLSADDPADLFDIAEATSRAAQADRRSLRTMLASLERSAALQDEVDRTKQALLRAEAEASRVTAEVEDALADRRSTLARLHEEIERLQEQARLAALRAARPDEAFARVLQTAGPAPEVPDGYVGTGVVFEGIASWYGPGFVGETTANGQIFDPRLYTAASRDLPFGTVLHVTHEGAGVVVVINDRGPFIRDRILDLSRAAADAIGLGLDWVRAEILVPEPT
jgi:rare lipoprotein A (peptidoglycan hydrolase)